MLTDVQLINGGLSKIAQNRVNRIDPATTSLEAFMASNYPHWKRTELTKRRWVFAYEEHYKLTLESTRTDGVDKPYKFALPIDCLRPVRTKTTEWVQRGRFVYSGCNELYIDYIRNAAEEEFDPLFDEVLMCRIALDSAEYVTQSNAKKEMAKALYDEAVSLAGQANAFVIGPEDIQEDDNDYSWLSARYGDGVI